VIDSRTSGGLLVVAGLERVGDADKSLAGIGRDRVDLIVADDAEGRLGVQELDGRPAVLRAQGDVARWASDGLQAPRIRYGSRSMSSFARSVAATSISVRIPNPSALSSSTTRGRSSSIDSGRRTRNT